MDMNEKGDCIEETKKGMVEGKLKENNLMHFTKQQIQLYCSALS